MQKYYSRVSKTGYLPVTHMRENAKPGKVRFKNYDPEVEDEIYYKSLHLPVFEGWYFCDCNNSGL